MIFNSKNNLKILADEKDLLKITFLKIIFYIDEKIGSYKVTKSNFFVIFTTFNQKLTFTLKANTNIFKNFSRKNHKLKNHFTKRIFNLRK